MTPQIETVNTSHQRHLGEIVNTSYQCHLGPQNLTENIFVFFHCFIIHCFRDWNKTALYHCQFHCHTFLYENFIQGVDKAYYKLIQITAIGLPLHNSF